MKANKISITSAELNELFRYDPESGKLYWRVDKSAAVRAGDEAGGRSFGYQRLTIDYRRYFVHRIIWLMAHGAIRTDLQVDHINGIRHDNRLENLRLVSHQGNQQNQTKAKGYYWNKLARKWNAQVKIDGKAVHLGYFDNEQDAHQAYLAGKKIHHVIL